MSTSERPQHDEISRLLSVWKDQLDALGFPTGAWLRELKRAALAAGANLLLMEAPFLAVDAQRAAQKYHLTTHQAGTLARAAGAKTVIPFHFSPRYNGLETQLRDELAVAFAGPQC
jgi:hypothetical protein